MTRAILKRMKWWAAVLLASLGFTTGAHAAPVAIDTMSIDSVSLRLTVTGLGTRSYTDMVSPPVDITMGSYQDPIVAGTNWKIYSSASGGNPAPSGTVDGTAGTINVDFSSLRGQVMWGAQLLDFALWPLTQSPSSGTYNAQSGIFILNWANSFNVSLIGFPSLSATATVSLGGTAAPVPLPAAVWLFGSGLIGLIGLARRRWR